jgi:hypothetical protein
MNLKSLIFAASALCAAVGLSTSASAAGSFGVTYFEVPSNFGGDFGICCSSPPATAALITLGAALGPNGRPVAEAGSTAIDVDAITHELGWWSAGSGITATGTGTLPLPLPLTNMYAPNSTGSNNGSFFETALLQGTFSGSGAPASLTVTSDDDAFVYLDGLYIGGNPGVHGNDTAVLNLGTLTGLHTLTVFYADRAQTGADLALTGVGLDTLSGTPEPATWGLMLVGFGGLGAMMRRRRSVALTA